MSKEKIRHNQNPTYIVLKRKIYFVMIMTRFHGFDYSYMPRKRSCQLLSWRTCSQKSLVQQLSSDISYAYDYYQPAYIQNNITPDLLDKIIHQIENEKYNISYLMSSYYGAEDIKSYLESGVENKLLNPHIRLEVKSLHKDAEVTGMVVTRPHNLMDNLVVTGLSLTFLRLLYGPLPTDCIGINGLYPAFIDRLNEIDKVERLYKIILDPLHLPYVTYDDIIMMIKPYFGNSGFLFRLIKDILDMPVYNQAKVQQLRDSPIPPLGEISGLLFEMIAMERFDKEFKLQFPDLTFYRNKNDVYIPCDNNIIFNENIGYSFLRKIGMLGEILSIQRGRDFLYCGIGQLENPDNYHKLVIMDSGKFKIYEIYHS